MFGASGDLTARKLLPALASLAGEGRSPTASASSASPGPPWTDDEFRDRCLEAVPDAKPAWAELVKRFRYVPGDYDDDATFDKLDADPRRARLARWRRRHGRQPDLLPRHRPLAVRRGCPGPRPPRAATSPGRGAASPAS